MEQITLTDIDDKLLAAFVREHPIRQIPALDGKGLPAFDKDSKAITKPECTPIQRMKRYAIAQIAREVLAGQIKMKLENDPTDKEPIETLINQNQD